MRTALAILTTAATVAIAPVPAFAHHNTSHSIAMRSAREQPAPCAAHEGAGVVTAISGNEITLPARTQCVHELAGDDHDL